MFQHHLLLIYRNFKQSKGSFFINLMGLSTGLACALLIYLWVADELSIDKFHQNDSRLFRVMERQQLDNGVVVGDKSAGLLAETLAEEMPEVEYATAVKHYSWFSRFVLSAKAHKSIKAIGQFASKDYFQVFSYGLIQGKAQEVLKDKNSIVISDEVALRLFNTTGNLIGKTIEWEYGPDKGQATVSGVFSKVPANSSEQFDFLLPFDVWKELEPEVLEWENNGTNTYVVLKPGTNLDQFNTKIAPLVEQFNSKIPPLVQGRNRGSNRTLLLAPYSAKYLYGNYENGVQSGGRITYVKLFSIVAVFILLIACINFMNLSTAKASRRIKEVGVKKVIGATRSNLISQYLGESMLMACISLLVAILLVWMLLPPFSQLTGKQLSLPLDMGLITALLAVTLFTGLVAGSYPALYLSGFSPAMVLKGKLHRSVGEAWTRKGLVVFQFSLSVILIVAVLVVYKQVAYIQNKNLGYTKDNILYFEREGKLQENQEAFLAEVKKIPGIVNASSISSSIIGSHNTTGGVHWKGRNPDAVVAFEVVRVNYDLIETLDIEMTEGRTFSKEFGTEASSIIFNEAAITAMGLKDPVGKTINLWGKNMQIVGIAKDFHFESLHEPVKPLFFILQPQNTYTFMVKISAGKEKAAIGDLRKLYRGFNPGYAFEYKFLDQDFQAQYAAEQIVAALSQYFAGLAILISCLGLFALAAFTAERRRKEIGIRKVLGSSEWEIIRLLSGDFTRIVLTAIVIALPISYVLTKSWLDNFAFSIDLEWWYFAAAGLIALLVAWLTVGVQALKAARANPVNSLKEE
jgi:predicted permease